MKVALKTENDLTSPISFLGNFTEWGRNNLRSSVVLRDKNSSFSKTLFKKLGASDFLRLSIPTEFGGLDQSLRDEVYAMRGLARGSLDLPFCLSALAQGIGIKVLVESANASQIEKFLAHTLSGDFLLGIANSEESGGTDIKSIRSKLELTDTGYANLTVHKSCASNVSDSDLVIASVWKYSPNQKPMMELMLLDRSMILQNSFNDSMMGFRTGQTASVSTKETMRVKVSDIQLGADQSGFRSLKLMFNLDRLFVGAMISGVLEGILELAIAHIQQRSSFGKSLAEFQHVQQKILDIYSAHIKLWGIIHKIIHSSDDRGPKYSDLENFTDELAILKILAMDEGLSACVAFFEVFGYRSYMNDSLASKLIQDILAFKFLGGSKEQQKIILFESLCKKYS